MPKNEQPYTLLKEEQDSIKAYKGNIELTDLNSKNKKSYNLGSEKKDETHWDWFSAKKNNFDLAIENLNIWIKRIKTNNSDLVEEQAFLKGDVETLIKEKEELYKQIGQTLKNIDMQEKAKEYLEKKLQIKKLLIKEGKNTLESHYENDLPDTLEETRL